MRQWRLITDSPTDGPRNMAVDDAILKAVAAGSQPPTLRLYGWQPLCLSLGYGQRVSDADADRLRAHGWGLVRRPTGGRAILHGDELTYSVALPIDHDLAQGTVIDSYRRISGALLTALQGLGFAPRSERQEKPSGGRGPVCFEVPSHYEITVEGRKLIGSAQVRRKDGLLQHGTLPLYGDVGRIVDALAYPTEAERETGRQRVRQRATTLLDLGQTIDWQQAADAFVARLLAGGTTTALVFGSQFIPATRALFGAAKRRGLRLIAGPTLMDRGGPHTPPELMTTPKAAYADSAALIREIADEPKLGYAVTPRFAPSCSPAMMETCGQLLVDFPESVLQTHINENHGEIEAAVKLFPEAAHYLAIYDRFGLLGRRTVLAHSIHSSDAELAMMAERGCAVCHCADSNLYLGSGLFPMARHLAAGIRLALGTDIGAGCHFSMLGELGQVHRIQQLQHFGLTAAKLLYLATLAGAEALGLAAHTGNFEIGKDADIIVLDPARNDYLQERLRYAGNAKEALFTLLMLANPGCIAKTWVAGYSAA